MWNLESYKVMIVIVTSLIVATASVGFAATSSDLSITKSFWTEVVSSDGTIAIDALTINVTNTSIEKYRKYHTCAQLTLINGTFGDISCVNSTTLAPLAQQNLLQIDFVKDFKISNLDLVAFDAEEIRELSVELGAEKNIVVKTNDINITFDEIQQSGTISIDNIKPSDAPEIISIDPKTDQITLPFQNQMMTSVSEISKITTTATFTGNILVEIPFDPTLIPSGISESQLKLLRYTNGAWTEVSSTLDSEKNTISGIITGFSQFMIVSPPSPPTVSSENVSTSGGGGGSRSGGSSSSVTVIFDIHLYEVSWNTCDDNLVTVIAGPPSDGLAVKLRTSKQGIIPATLSSEQPFSNKSVFEARIDPSEYFVLVQVEGISSRSSLIAQASINLDRCLGMVILESDETIISDDESSDVSIPSDVTKSTPFSSTTPSIPGGKQFMTSYDEIDFEINYKINSGNIVNMLVDENRSMLVLQLDEIKAGHLVLSLPRSLINAVDDRFVLFDTKSGNVLNYSVLKSEDTYVIILFIVPEDLSEITILGTSVVPEFGLMAMSILSMMFIFLIFIVRRIPYGNISHNLYM